MPPYSAVFLFVDVSLPQYHAERERMDLGPVIGSENTCKVAEPSIKETFVFVGGGISQSQNGNSQ